VSVRGLAAADAAGGEKQRFQRGVHLVYHQRNMFVPGNTNFHAATK